LNLYIFSNNIEFMGFLDKIKRALGGGKDEAVKAGKAVEHGAEKAGKDVEHGAKDVEHGAEKAGKDVEHGAEKTDDAIDDELKK
jgi:hypothetical protein